MALPGWFVASRVPALPPEERRSTAPPGGAAAPAAADLSFVMEPQAQDNWCWAAVAASVAAFYSSTTPWTQCALADAELQRDDCCGDGASVPCNVPWYLDTSLARVGRLNGWTDGASSFAAVIDEIDAGNPLCARTAWEDGSAHFVALVGYIRAGGEFAEDFVRVADPLYGDSEATYAAFRDAYRGTGGWTHGYRCK